MAQAKGSAPTMDLVLSDKENRTTIPYEERRWTEVANFRAMLKRSGLEVEEPLVPRSHMPLGCVVVRFRHLRSAVWGIEPTEIYRTLRLGCRGNLRLEIDFRPRFFRAKTIERARNLTADEEDELYSVKP